jgi:hypothetical protein
MEKLNNTTPDKEAYISHTGRQQMVTIQENLDKSEYVNLESTLNKCRSPVSSVST